MIGILFLAIQHQRMMEHKLSINLLNVNMVQTNTISGQLLHKTNQLPDNTQCSRKGSGSTIPDVLCVCDIMADIENCVFGLGSRIKILLNDK